MTDTRHIPDRISEDPEFEGLLFGFWVFLMSDLVLFAVLFATYASMSRHGVSDGPAPSDIVELKGAFIETVLLLLSSITIGFASLAVKHHADHAGPTLWLAATFVLGAAFIALEARDFYNIVAMNAPPQRSGFLSAFFTLVGAHGIHVAAGLVWILLMLVQIRTLGVSFAVRLRVIRLALFWHVLDIVWIGIFTFVFLAGAAG